MSEDNIQKFDGKALRSVGNIEIEGEALVSKSPITLLGFVDAKTGTITEKGHELNGKEITGKIFVFPRGIGSTVGPYVLINLVKNEKQPLAIINRESDQGTISGCSVAGIPMAYGLSLENEPIDPTEKIKSGDKIRLIIEKGKASIELLS